MYEETEIGLLGQIRHRKNKSSYFINFSFGEKKMLFDAFQSFLVAREFSSCGFALNHLSWDLLLASLLWFSLVSWRIAAVS